MHLLSVTTLNIKTSFFSGGHVPSFLWFYFSFGDLHCLLWLTLDRIANDYKDFIERMMIIIMMVMMMVMMM